MTDKERLVELLESGQNLCKRPCSECPAVAHNPLTCDLHLLADHLIANGVVVQKQGEWIEDGYCDLPCVCSVCGCGPTERMFCGSCGAKMVKEDK